MRLMSPSMPANRFFMVLIVALFLMLTGTKSIAQDGFGTLYLTVVDRTGARISNVNLCLAMPNQNMGRMTDQNGVYNTPLPVGTTTIRLSRTGYANAAETVTVTNAANVVRQIQLQAGQSTPLPSNCSITATTSPAGSCNTITNIEVTGGTTTTSRNLNILVGFSQKPAYYRATEFSAAEQYSATGIFDPTAAFENKHVPWQPVPSPILSANFTLTEPQFGTHVIYLQTRQYESGCISDARSVSVTLAPAQLETYTLKGQDLQRFINAAKSRGYQFVDNFQFIRKKAGICAGSQPTAALEGHSRASDTIIEDVSASFEVFVGPEMTPYWKLLSIEAEHLKLRLPFFLPFTPPLVGQRPTMQWDLGLTGVRCDFCTPSSIKRKFVWRRYLYDVGPQKGLGPLFCPDTSEGADVRKVVLEGPAGVNPIYALGSLLH